MKKVLIQIVIFLVFAKISVAQGSNIKVDSVYNNVFENVSVYKRFSDIYIGNLGLAKYSLLSPFNDNRNSLYNVFEQHQLDKGYTDIFFASGSGKEGLISVYHNQKLGKRIKAKLNLTQTSSEGFFLEQKASIGTLVANINYLSKNNKYEFTLLGDFYKRKNQLNGGITDSAFNFYYENDALRLLYPTNLSGANLEKSTRIYDYTHSYKIYTDSVKTLKIKQQFNYEVHKYQYSDGVNDFYANYFIDSLGSYDTLKLQYLTHNLFLDYGYSKSNVYLGISNSYADYKADSVFIPSMIHSVLAGYKYQYNKFKFTSDFSYTFSGFLKGNLFTRNNISYIDSNFIFDKTSAYVEYSVATPLLYNYQFYSNHLKWNKNLNLENKIQFNFNSISSKYNIEIGGEFQVRNNFVFYNNVSIVDQTDITFMQFNIAKQFKITNWLYYTPKLFYQKVTSNQAIDLPQIVTQNRLYGQGRLFKKILTFKVGVDVLYYTDFYAKAYNPSFDIFYTQNNQKAGQYPLIDVFAEFYSKNNLAFFIKATHANYGFMGTNYLASPNYRIQDRTINFGVKWRLYN